MSGIKLRSQKALATDDNMISAPREALIVAHGQPGDPNPPEIELARLAVQVQERMVGWRILSATMACPGALETAAKDIAPRALVYPFFMSEGWFVREALPERLAAYQLRYLPPFGTDPELPTFAALEIRREISLRGWSPERTHIVIVAHGSKRCEHAADAVQSLTKSLAALLPCADIQIGFLDQAPYVSQVATDLGPQALCLPFFANEGDHITKDIPQTLGDVQFQGILLQVLGQQALVPDLIARTLEAAYTAETAV